MVYELRALLPIKEGEQIFVSYLDNLQTRWLGGHIYDPRTDSYATAQLALFLPQISPSEIIFENYWPRPCN